MISARDALGLAAGRPPDSVISECELTERESMQLDYLDSMVETGIHKSFRGGVFDFKIPSDKVEIKVVNALKQRYERGGWQVGIVLLGDESNVIAFQVIFACAGVTAAAEGEAPPETFKPVKFTLPPVVRHGENQTTYSGYRVLVRMPTRQRPAQALAMLEHYRRMAGCTIAIEVVVDEDDETMLSAEILQRLAALDCIVTTGVHGSKIAACNGGSASDWDILVLASDDMMPIVDGYAVRLISEMIARFPLLDGALHFNDGHQRSNLCTLPVFGRRLYDQFGCVYDPEYKSLFCDREQTDLLKSMGRLSYVDEKIIDHRHHIWGRGVEKDALYERNDALEEADKATFHRRKETVRPHAQWGFDSPPLWLSVLICTVPKRQAQLEWLTDSLYRQIVRDAPRQVEILIDDREAIPVGEKRQSLLERSKGHFVAFVDDDDGVAVDYVKRVVGAVSADPTVDCTSLEGVMTTAGNRPEVFRHSIAFDGWYTRDKIHYRTPNHLNAIRRDLALKTGFVSKSVGEDHEFSKRIRPLLLKEASTGEAPLYFYWFDPSNSVQAAPK